MSSDQGRQSSQSPADLEQLLPIFWVSPALGRPHSRFSAEE